MTTHSKEKTRLLARAESMRQAIVESPLPQQWERMDLDHMADAALMLWDQANDLVLKEPGAKTELSEAISLIFEPLLLWSGRFELACALARQRAALPDKGETARKPTWHPVAAQFIALCFQGRFQDDQPESRRKTFEQACRTYEGLAPHFDALDAATMAQLAHGWHLMGMPGVARQLLDRIRDEGWALKYYTTLNAPTFWKLSHVSRQWMDSLGSEP